MKLSLNNIHPAPGARQTRKRVGRGVGSGLGKTAGRGHKGQRSRTGGFHKVGFEGGQMPLQRRLPKRGFVSINRDQWARIRLSDLNLVQDGQVTRESLLQSKLIVEQASRVKIYLSGKITKKFQVRDPAIVVSAGARAAILAAGGEVQVVEPVSSRPARGKSGEKKESRVDNGQQ